MIRTFKCKETENIFARQCSRKFPQDIQQVILRKLRMLNRAATLRDLFAPPANRLEKLLGERSGQYSIASMINGVSALNGRMVTSMTWKSQIIIRSKRSGIRRQVSGFAWYAACSCSEKVKEQNSPSSISCPGFLRVKLILET